MDIRQRLSFYFCYSSNFNVALFFEREFDDRVVLVKISNHFLLKKKVDNRNDRKIIKKSF